MFTEKEITYLKSQRLARIATVNSDGQPDVTPVGFEFNGTNFYIGGRNMTTTHKYKNIENGQAKIALVIDDMKSIDPWQPRGIRVYGTGELIDYKGYAGDGRYIRLNPHISWSWNIESSSHKTIHTESV